MSKNFVFGVKPNISIPRNKFDLSHTHKTTMNVGDLVPVLLQEVYPGDSFKDKTAFVARSTTPFIRPVIDNLFLEMHYFFVPNRLVYDKWRNVMGENTDGYWANNKEYVVPQIEITGLSSTRSIANHFGIPLGIYPAGFKVNVLPFRGYGLIWNEWFRDENLQEPVLINTGDIDATSIDKLVLDGDPFGNVSEGYYVANLARVNKLHDYFTSALPSPQKGDAVEVPIGGISPIKTSDIDVVTGQQFPMNFRNANNGNLPPNGGILTGFRVSGAGQDYKTSLGYSEGNGITSSYGVYPSNLYADYADANLFVNDLRYAFQLQKMLERDARGGTRYVEYIASHFNVISPDQTQQRPEYLGGARMPLNVQQVSQTSQSTAESPLAQVSAFSLSSGISGFSKSFTEHGFVFGLACIRYKHSYQQGVNRMWFRNKRTDYYDPVFANIGEQPIYRKEIYAFSDRPDAVFGYNEAFADLRYTPNYITGELSTTSKTGLDVWHFGDNYANAPLLSSDFIEENRANVQRTLSASSVDDFIVDFYHQLSAVRPMPLYSIPGLIDHH